MCRQLCFVHFGGDRCTDHRWTVPVSRIILNDQNRTYTLIDTAVGYDQSKITQLDSFDPVSLSGNYYQTGRFFDYFDEDMLSVVAPITSNLLLTLLHLTCQRLCQYNRV